MLIKGCNKFSLIISNKFYTHNNFALRSKTAGITNSKDVSFQYFFNFSISLACLKKHYEMYIN